MKTMILAVLIFATAIPVMAAKKKEAPEPEESSFSVNVPRSELSLPPLEQENEAKTAQSWSFGASSWAPDRFERGGFRGASAFERGSLPYFFGEVSTPIVWNGGDSLRSRFGAGYVSLERAGNPALGGTNFTPVQELRLLQLRLGLEYETGALMQVLHPYAGFAALPTFAMAAQSQFEERVSSFGVPMEASAGLRIRPRFLREFWSFRDGGLGLGGHYTFGTIDSSSLRGLGAQAYLQVHL